MCVCGGGLLYGLDCSDALYGKDLIRNLWNAVKGLSVWYEHIFFFNECVQDAIGSIV